MTDAVNVLVTGPLTTVADDFVILADTNLRNIYQVNVTTGAMAQLLPFGLAHTVISLAYDSTAKLLYWSDGYHETINVYSLLTNSSTVIYTKTNSSNNGRLRYIRYFVTDRPCTHIFPLF